MIKFSGSFKLKEIHIVDSPFNEDPKNILFSREAIISREGWPKNLGKMGNNRDIYCYANRRVVNFEREYQPLSLGRDSSIVPHARSNFRKKLKNSIFRPNFDLSLGSSKIQGRIQKF